MVSVAKFKDAKTVLNPVPKYKYDQFGNITELVDPMGKAETYTYDENGNLTTKVDKNRAAYTMGYDGLNRLISQTATSTKGENSVKNIEYYLQGGIKSFNLTCQERVILDASFNYDKLNRMVEVKREGTPEAHYTYDENSNLEETKYADGSFGTRYSYNLANQVKGVENFNATNTVPKFTYDYQADGNRITENDATANTNKKFAYDDANRLILEQYSQGKNQGTKFDDYGNIVSQENQGDYTTYQYDLNSRLTYKCQKVGNVLTISKYTYDANGSQVSIRTIKSTDKQATNNIEGTFLTNKGVSEFFEYNVLGQLVKVTRPGKMATYTYNPTGLRDSITVNGQTKRQIWDVGNVVAETDKYGTLKATYLYGTGLVSKKDSLGKEYFYFKNAHSDVVALTDRQGKVCRTYEYDSYGNFTSKGEAIDNPFTYFGQYFDEETGNYYLRARYYSPSQQRFISEDSYRGVVTDPLSLNLYLYCSGNPVMYSDPSGHDKYREDKMKEAQRAAYMNFRKLGGGDTSSMIVGCVPIVGDGKDIQEALTGIDLITGEKLTKTERAITVVMVFVPVVNGKLARSGVEVVGQISEDTWKLFSKTSYVKSSPIEIPSNAKVVEQAKNGYDQVKYTWSDGTYNFEARWHTKTPGAPATQGDTWVITRTTPGTPTGQMKVQNILTGENEWTSMSLWQEAVTARKNGVASSAQEALLDSGHWPAK